MPMQYVLGVVIGVAGSFLAWYLTARVIRPSIRIGPQVSRVDGPEGWPQYVYRVKVVNRRRRQAIDVEFGATLDTKGIHADRIDNWNVYEVPIDSPSTRRLPPRGSRIVWIDLRNAHDLIRRLPALEATKQRDGTLRLEELLALNGGSVLRFFVRCNDGFSGAPCLFEWEYRSGSVGVGLFEKSSASLVPEARRRLEIYELGSTD